jgi:hypothetical protein
LPAKMESFESPAGRHQISDQSRPTQFCLNLPNRESFR